MTMSSTLAKLLGSSDTPGNTSAESTPTSTEKRSAPAGSSLDAQSSSTPRPATQPDDDAWAPWNLLPAALLAAELNVTVDALVRQIGNDAVVLDDLGMRNVSRSTARGVIAEQRAREARRRDLEAQETALSAEKAKLADADRARRRAALAQQGPPSGNAAADLMKGHFQAKGEW